MTCIYKYIFHGRERETANKNKAFQEQDWVHVVYKYIYIFMVERERETAKKNKSYLKEHTHQMLLQHAQHDHVSLDYEKILKILTYRQFLVFLDLSNQLLLKWLSKKKWEKEVEKGVEKKTKSIPWR